jgi:hypothetical protein
MISTTRNESRCTYFIPYQTTVTNKHVWHYVGQGLLPKNSSESGVNMTIREYQQDQNTGNKTPLQLLQCNLNSRSTAASGLHVDTSVDPLLQAPDLNS